MTVAASAGARELLTVLRDGKPRTRARLAEMLGVARSTIGLRVEELIALGYVQERPDPVYTGGRPSTWIELVPAVRVVLAADIGATHVRAAVTDLLGGVLLSLARPLTGGGEPTAVLDDLQQDVEAAMRDHGLDLAILSAVGVGLAAPVDRATGRPFNPPIMPRWDGFDVADHLRARWDVPVAVEKDVNMMAVGEFVTRPGRPQNLVFAKMASGIGAGMIMQGRLHRGEQGTAGDIGHITVAGEDAPCHCGNRGCLEAVASGPALAQRLRALGHRTASTADVADLVGRGDLDAIQAVRQAGRDLGGVLASCVSIVNPSVIVVGGSLAVAAGESLLAGVREVVYANSMPLAAKSLSIVQADPVGDVAIRGASTMAVERALDLTPIS